MPYKANEARRHRIPRARYRVTNWPDYDRALQRRGSLTVWVTPEALAVAAADQHAAEAAADDAAPAGHAAGGVRGLGVGGAGGAQGDHGGE